MRRVLLRYVSKENETPRSIAKKMGMELAALLQVGSPASCPWRYVYPPGYLYLPLLAGTAPNGSACL